MRPTVTAIAVLALAGNIAGRGFALDGVAAPPPPAGGASDAPPASDGSDPAETARRRADRRAREQQAAWRQSHPGKAYSYGDDPKHGIVWASCLPPERQSQVLAMLAAQSEQQAAYLFGGMPETEVFVAVGTEKDVKKVVGGSATTGGVYEHPKRRIVIADPDVPLRHEWTHAMHFAHMERLGQPHAMWVQEGLAALYERYEIAADGAITFLPTERHDVARKAASNRKGLTVASMAAMEPDPFMAKSQTTYPVARSVFEFMADRGKLRAWYRRYVETFAKDPTGRAAIESTFGMSVEDFDRAWREWVLARPAGAGTRAAAPGHPAVLPLGLDRPGSSGDFRDRALPQSES
jgi:hypothetical protein